MAKRITKDEFFQGAFAAGRVTTELFDLYYLGYPENANDSSMLRVFGADHLEQSDEYDEESAKSRYRETPVWRCFDELFGYVTEGILPEGMDGDELVHSSSMALDTVPSEQAAFKAVAEELLSAAIGRTSLDNGKDIELMQLAYLANIDERSVRNAVSSGELNGTSGKPVYIDNKSARSWLLKRRGYIPTRIPTEQSKSVANINTPAEFGAFLKFLNELNAISESRQALHDHSEISEGTFELLEAGIFNLPLDVCPALADFYQIERTTFLATVMKVFYKEELRSLTQGAAKSRGGNDGKY